MKFKQSFLLLLFFTSLIHAHAQGKFRNGMPDICAQLPLFQYKKGMHFYFPPDPLHRRRKNAIPGYSMSSGCSPQNAAGDTVGYDYLAEKTFTLVAIDSSALNPPWKEKHVCLVFTLVDKDTVYYTFPKDAMARSLWEFTNGQYQSLNLGYAICKEALANSADWVKANGVQYFYTRFPVKAGNGSKPVKYQRVEVTRIAYGTWQAPVRVYFKSDAIPEQSIDVIICGTNVPAANIPGNRFGEKFQADDPQVAANPKNQGKFWQDVCLGQVKKNMTCKEVGLALGKPLKVDKDEGATIKTTYWYDKQQVYMENGVVTEVKSTSKAQ